MKVLLLYDMEGVSGAVKPADVNFGSPSYPATRESLSEDVNAAIRGLMKAGATEVVITDGHGSGNSDPDYLLDKLPKGARSICGTFLTIRIETMDKSFDAMVAVAMHGRAGGRAFLAHTYNGHTKWVMAGHDMNESMLVAASAARFDIPLVLVTGDDVLRDEIKAFSPEADYVVVKKGGQRIGGRGTDTRGGQRRHRGSGRARPEEPRAGQAVAPKEISAGEFDNVYSYVLPEQAAVAINFPGASVVDNKTVRVGRAAFSTPISPSADWLALRATRRNG